MTRARDDVGGWLREIGVRFFPVVNWAERGNFGDGNSVPRFHMTWGTGKALVQAVWGAIEKHPRRAGLEVRFGARVSELLIEHAHAVGCRVVRESAGGEEGEGPAGAGPARAAQVGTGARDRYRNEQASGPEGTPREGEEYEVRATRAVVMAAGGIGGNLEIVRREWPTERLGSPPRKILMGSHRYADGALHEEVARLGGNVTHLSRMWNYADAVRHPRPQREHHGLKLIPPRSGVMLNPDGRRYGPVPVMPDLRCLRRAGAHVRGRAQVLVADLQLEDRHARAGCVGLAAQPPPARAPPGALPAGRAARQARPGAPLPGWLARLRLGLHALRAGAEDERRHRRSGDRRRRAGARRSAATTRRSRAARASSTTTSCDASRSCATGAGTACARARSSASSIPRRSR